MTDLRACAERVLRYLYTGHPPNITRDAEQLARAVLSSLDVPDREQLLADADAVLNDIEVCERGSHYFVDGAGVDDVLASAQRLADHTRRTLGEK